MNHYDIDTAVFTVENYQHKSPFANFLPGIAGKMGIPLWAFYVNRGQGISGFGLNNKNHPIMAFTPANKAYESVSQSGFRTFFKVDGQYYEPFRNDSSHPHKMMIERPAFAILEHNEAMGIKTHIRYFGLPNETLAGLVRTVTVTNTGKTTKQIEMLDGLAEILPAGMTNEAYKSVSNLLASWVDVNHLDENLAYYMFRASTEDSPEVNGVSEGNFYLGFDQNGLIRPIVDQNLVFGHNTSKSVASQFIRQPLQTLRQAQQYPTNKIPCAFVPYEITLKPSESFTLYACAGHVANIDVLKEVLPRLTNKEAMIKKQQEAIDEVERLLLDVETKTAQPLFDAYIKQNYLDNLLRGGYPEVIGNSVFHLYSRRHGDLERDYNFFSLAPEFYSHGSGNFRDICQNRRMDTFINRSVAAFNIHHFASLIQLDGYNPLAVNGTVYTMRQEVDLPQLLAKHFSSYEKLLPSFDKPFTPGSIVNDVYRHALEATSHPEVYLADLINHADAHISATFGEGYWIDHFTYVLDLIETYESIYPDKMQALLYEDARYTYFDSPVSIKKKAEKIVLNQHDAIRQYGSLIHLDQEKVKRLGLNPHGSNWAKIAGKTYASNLFVKLLIIVLNKHSLLDPDGFGIEMDADKPGWNDAMNGLPGMLGSGVSETIELWRIVDFLIRYGNYQQPLAVPVEVETFFHCLNPIPSYAERVACREAYRDAIRFGLSGDMGTLSLADIDAYLRHLQAYIENQLNTLYKDHDKIPPTFMTYEVTAYDVLETKRDSSSSPHQLVAPRHYNRKPLAAFLEAPARLLKTDFDLQKKKAMHEAVLSSDIFDQTLRMFKTSGPIENECHEIGRIHAFTKGWLERESNFLHMTYKYVLGLLKAGMYDAFYEAIKDNLVCFMDSDVYGRNPLENSSFIVPTNNPDPTIHGKGFFARLSGSTVEVINMWAVMMTGGKPFVLEEGTLTLRLSPKLHKDYFKSDNTVTFTFLKTIQVTYVNHQAVHTYDRCDIDRITLVSDQEEVVVEGDCLKGELAEAVRAQVYKRIVIDLNRLH